MIENKPGGGGSVGTALITQARPDGYTLLMNFNGPMTTLPHSLQVPYTLDSYTPIIQVGSGSYVLCTAPDFPAANAKELIANLKQNPGKYTYGNDGVGNTMQLAAERIFRHFDVKARPVPFGGAGETARNFLGGHVDFYGGSLPPILPHVAAGKAKCLMLTSAADNPAMPGASGLAAPRRAGARDGAVVGADRAEGPARQRRRDSRQGLPRGGRLAALQGDDGKAGRDAGRARLQGDGRTDPQGIRSTGRGGEGGRPPEEVRRR